MLLNQAPDQILVAPLKNGNFGLACEKYKLIKCVAIEVELGDWKFLYLWTEFSNGQKSLYCNI